MFFHKCNSYPQELDSRYHQQNVDKQKITKRVFMEMGIMEFQPLECWEIIIIIIILFHT